MEKDNLKASVIIPTYNREKELRQILELLSKQDRPADEILVIDQTPNHEPQTKMLLEEFVRENKIRLLCQDKASLSMARNYGIRESRGDILIFIDDDVLFESNFIKAHLNNYADKDVDGVSGMVLSPEIPEPTENIRPDLFDHPFGWLDFPLNFSRRTKTILMVGCNFSIKKSMAIKVRGSDNNFIGSARCEDNDFSWRVFCAGGRIVHDPLVKVFSLSTAYGGCRFLRERWHLPSVDELQNVLYFYLKDFSLCYKMLSIIKKFRQWVLNKGNLANPYYFFVAFMRFGIALVRAINLWASGSKEMTDVI